ncbi:hypothetical protein D9756_004558 [Leucocoprinus leucothites]|uniref:Retrotransposon gag domain-containing protein n=1 Tax=Leucocoprinus leucothites TaxID=201217 RepID=A0A8H5G9M5_9AGAR|nr:hypothetical protein D9756_004558 [Leucoagaricus leucothites]
MIQSSVNQGNIESGRAKKPKSSTVTKEKMSIMSPPRLNTQFYKNSKITIESNLLKQSKNKSQKEPIQKDSTHLPQDSSKSKSKETPQNNPSTSQIPLQNPAGPSNQQLMQLQESEKPLKEIIQSPELTLQAQRNLKLMKTTKKKTKKEQTAEIEANKNLKEIEQKRKQKHLQGQSIISNSNPQKSPDPRFLSSITNPIPFSFTDSPTSIASTSTLPATNPNIATASTTITIPANTQTKGKAKAIVTNTRGSSNQRSPTPPPPNPQEGPPSPRGNPPGGPGGPGVLEGGGGPPNPNPNPPPNLNMAQPQAGFQLKHPKPNRFDGNPSYYRPWVAKVELYFNSYGVTSDTQRINYTLGLLNGAAKLWQQDYRLSQATAATQAGYVAHTFDQFKNTLEQLFTPTQQSFEAERELCYYRQRNKYIKEYIANFSILASDAGLVDSTSLRSYFAKGLDNGVRFEAI